MPTEDKPIENDTFKVLLDKIASLEEQINDTNTKLNEVTAFNRELLSRKAVNIKSSDIDDSELNDKANKFLHE